MITEEYQYNDYSPAIQVNPEEWRNMEIMQLYGQMQLMQNRLNICLASYPNLAGPLYEGIAVLKNIIYEKEKLC